MSIHRNAKIAVAISCTVAGAVSLNGCSAISSIVNRGSSAIINILPVDGGGDQVSVDEPLQVDVSEGRLIAVRVEGPTGVMKGTLTSDGSRWIAKKQYLAYGAQYQVSVRALDASGEPQERSVSFSTMKPANTNQAYLAYVSDGDDMGVGMPLRLEFERPVENRAEVERALLVRTSSPVVGAWGWDPDGKVVTFRPQSYWPAYSNVQLVAGLRGIETSPGVFGEADLTAKLHVGSKMISTVDAASLEMTVRRNDEVIATLPVTTGKYGFETRSGIKPIMAKEGTVVMDAASGGTSRNSSEYYRLTVQDSMRLTWSGEYVHAAPWSTGSQGVRSVSHGCIGMSSSDASWFYGISSVGDVVVVRQTGRKQDVGNGITEWMIPWNKWLTKSSTGPVTTTASLKKPEVPADDESDDVDESQSS